MSNEHDYTMNYQQYGQTGPAGPMGPVNPMSPTGSGGQSGPTRVTIFDTLAEPIQLDLSAFGKYVVTFGRGEGNDIRLNSTYVSRKHGQFRYDNGNWIIEDLQSMNGLLFEGMKIPGRILEDGDFIRVDDGVQAKESGLLMVVSKSTDAEEWRTFDMSARQETTIGRDGRCDIVLEHVSVSKFHARIITRSGQYCVVDNNSTNGVMVNGRRVSGHQYLNEKDVIIITNSKLIFSGGRISYCCFKKGISVDALGITKRVDKNRKVICNNVSLNIKPCELVAIVGGSGAGKSTVMNCISGYSMPTEGRVSVNGIDLYDNFDTLKNIIGYVPQQDIVFDNLTIEDMLRYAAELRLPEDIAEEELNRIISRAIDTVELTIHKEKMIKNLSGGQKKRASIAVELLSDPNLFFLDEPASGLDPGTERNLMGTLRNMAAGERRLSLSHTAPLTCTCVIKSLSWVRAGIFASMVHMTRR